MAKWLPKKEAPLVMKGKALHNVIDADQKEIKWNKNSKKKTKR